MFCIKIWSTVKTNFYKLFFGARAGRSQNFLGRAGAEENGYAPQHCLLSLIVTGTILFKSDSFKQCCGSEYESACIRNFCLDPDLEL